MPGGGVQIETSSDDVFLIESSDETFNVDTGSDNTFSIGEDPSDESEEIRKLKQQLALDFSDGQLSGLQATLSQATVTSPTVEGNQIRRALTESKISNTRGSNNGLISSSSPTETSQSDLLRKRVASVGNLITKLSKGLKTTSKNSSPGSGTSPSTQLKRAASASTKSAVQAPAPKCNTTSVASTDAKYPIVAPESENGKADTTTPNKSTSAESPEVLVAQSPSDLLRERAASVGNDLMRKDSRSETSIGLVTTPKSVYSAASAAGPAEVVKKKLSSSSLVSKRRTHSERNFRNSTPKSSSSDASPSVIKKGSHSSLRTNSRGTSRSRQGSGITRRTSSNLRTPEVERIQSSADDERGDSELVRRVSRTGSINEIVSRNSSVASRKSLSGSIRKGESYSQQSSQGSLKKTSKESIVRTPDVEEEAEELRYQASLRVVSWWRACALRLRRRELRSREVTLADASARRFAATLIQRLWKSHHITTIRARRKREEAIINRVAITQELTTSSSMIKSKWKEKQASAVKRARIDEKENNILVLNKQSTLQEKNFAATLIQSRWKARHAKEVVRCLLLQREPDYEILARQGAALEKSYAARMITRWVRIAVARMECSKRRKSRDHKINSLEMEEKLLWNATFIQSWTRGCHGRKIRNTAQRSQIEEHEINARSSVYDVQYNERLVIRQKHFDFIGRHWHWAYNNGEESDSDNETSNTKIKPIFRFTKGTLSNSAIVLRAKKHDSENRNRTRAAMLSSPSRDPRDMLRNSNVISRFKLKQQQIRLLRSIAVNYLSSLLVIQRVGKAAATRSLITSVVFVKKKATTIQLTWRSYKSRCERRRLKDERITQRKNELNKRKEEAATSIQQSFRSSKAREEAKRRRGIRQLEFQTIAVLEHKENQFHNAAILQRIGRAARGRSNLSDISRKSFKRNVEIITSFSRGKLSYIIVRRLIEKHIILIQKTFRRYQAYREAWWRRRLRSANIANKELAELQQNSATVIQRWIRICVARVTVSNLKKIVLARDAWDVVTEKIEQSVIIIQCAVRTMIAKRRSQLQRDSLNRLHKMELDAHINDLQETLKTITQMYPSHGMDDEIDEHIQSYPPVPTATELDDTLQTIRDSYPGIRNNKPDQQEVTEVTSTIQNVSSEMCELQEDLQAMRSNRTPSISTSADTDLDITAHIYNSPISDDEDLSISPVEESYSPANRLEALKARTTHLHTADQMTTKKQQSELTSFIKPSSLKKSREVLSGDHQNARITRARTANGVETGSRNSKPPEESPRPELQNNKIRIQRMRPESAPCSDVPLKLVARQRNSKLTYRPASLVASSPRSSITANKKQEIKKTSQRKIAQNMKYKSDTSPYMTSVDKRKLSREKTSIPQPALSPLSADTSTRERQIPQAVYSPSSLGTPPISRRSGNKSSVSPLYAYDTEAGGPTLLVDPTTGAGYQIVPYSGYPIQSGQSNEMFESTATTASAPPSRDPRRKRKLPGAVGSLTGEVVESFLFGNVAEKHVGVRTRHDADLLLADAVASSIRKNRRQTPQKKNWTQRASDIIPADGTQRDPNSNLVLYRPMSSVDKTTPVHLISIEDDPFPSYPRDLTQTPSGSAVHAARQKADTQQAWS